MLKVYWFGYGGHSWMAERLRETIEVDLGMKLVTIHEHPDANIKWELNTVYEELKKADIIIIPSNYKRYPCKSNNRLTQAMALGKAIICDPMPAYTPIVKQLENAIITQVGDEREYKIWLQFLRDNESKRIEMGKKALETSKKYTLDETAKQWLKALSNLPKRKFENRVDVIIPTKNNNEILNECLKSFSNSSLEEEVYIVDNSCSDSVENLVKGYGFPYEVREV